MSLAFDLEVGTSSRLRGLVAGLHLIAAAALAGTGALAWDSLGPLDLPRAAAAALAGGAALATLGWSLARGLRARHSGTLSVDPRGGAHWREQGAPGTVPAAATRWFSLGGLVWIEARMGRRRIWLVSGRDRCGDRVWAGLNRWFRWLERGAQA